VYKWNVYYKNNIRVGGVIASYTHKHTYTHIYIFPFPFKFLRSIHWQRSPSQHHFTINGNHPWWDWRFFFLEYCVVQAISNNPMFKYGNFYPFFLHNLVNFLETFPKNPLLKCRTSCFFGHHLAKFQTKKHFLICLVCGKFGEPMKMLRKGVFTFVFSMFNKIGLCVSLKDFKFFFVTQWGYLILTLVSLIF
jgi:hypothetical protein